MNLAFALLPNPKSHNLIYSPDISLDFKGISEVSFEALIKSTANLNNSSYIVRELFAKEFRFSLFLLKKITKNSHN